tara:strand:- start:30 stop:332 length:303 start_codon:yes stop_codon:yes gene_type:complete
MIYYVDIDGTICTQENKNDTLDYDKAKPRPEQIQKINKLYDDGHTIVYWTARGTVTGIDWNDLTENQLRLWGCKYHDLRVGTKPHYDVWVDDKSIKIEEL